MIVGEIYRDKNRDGPFTTYFELIGFTENHYILLQIAGLMPYRENPYDGLVYLSSRIRHRCRLYEATELKELVESVLNNENE